MLTSWDPGHVTQLPVDGADTMSGSLSEMLGLLVEHQGSCWCFQKRCFFGEASSALTGGQSSAGNLWGALYHSKPGVSG